MSPVDYSKGDQMNGSQFGVYLGSMLVVVAIGIGSSLTLRDKLSAVERVDKQLALFTEKAEHLHADVVNTITQANTEVQQSQELTQVALRQTHDLLSYLYTLHPEVVTDLQMNTSLHHLSEEVDKLKHTQAVWERHFNPLPSKED